MSDPRARLAVGIVAVILLVCVCHPARAGEPEKRVIALGVPIPAIAYLPLYLVADRTAKPEGLAVELITFQSESAAHQALAGGSVDVIVSSLRAIVSLIGAGHRVRSFYAGLQYTGFEWFARPGTRGWEDLRGKTVAISAPGTPTDALTRHALRKRGLEPGRDVLLVSGGSPSSRWQALRAGRVDCALLNAPLTWKAESEGFVRVGSETTEVGRGWTGTSLITSESFLDRNPQTIRALLRSLVRGIRMVKTDPETSIQTLMSRLKYDRHDAERAHVALREALDERGGFSVSGVRGFWEMAVAAGEVDAPWPESRYVDRRWLDRFDAWAPE